ncbi:MAG: excinuclease ABC subunit UvrC [Candidatus Anammoxibacter sp.]
MQLINKIKAFPTYPGVYMMKDDKNEVIYVGKAKNLRNRVKSYFQVNSDERLYRQFLVKRIRNIDFLVTDTEKEALILENNLIKQFKPRFNINLRDDKTFVSIKIDINKPFPYLRIVRQIKNDGSLFFGPYSSTKSVRETIRYINEIFSIRKCNDNVFKNRKRPCLYYQLDKCSAPCCNQVDKMSYRDLIDQIILILKGKNDKLLKILKKDMGNASKSMRYEDAAKIRDRITSIETTVEKQKIHSMKFIDRDVFGYKVSEKEICIQAMFIRSGNLIDVSSYHFSIKYNDPEEAFSSFLNQFYNKNNFIPKEVIIPVKSKDKNILEEVLTELKGQKVDVIWPQRGEKLKLVQMAQKNAGNSLMSLDNQEEKCHDILENVAKVLGLNSIPETIECFDVSNISGEHAVGAMVVFKMGIPHKPAYRRYRIKGVTQSDDFAMMREILKRRYVRAQKMDNFPNLIIIDGGKGHTGVALNLFKELGIADLNVIGIAKGHKRNNTFDRVYLPDNNEPVDLKSDSSELLFIQKIRDEAHRFANTYHKKLRKKAQFAT